MTEVRDRATIQAHQAEVEKSVVERSSSTRDAVKKLYKSAKKAKEVDIAAGNDECTAMFIQEKSDARAFATYYRDNILGPEAGGQAAARPAEHEARGGGEQVARWQPRALLAASGEGHGGGGPAPPREVPRPALTGARAAGTNEL